MELQNPWLGLSSYDEPNGTVNDRLFCGRDEETLEMVRLIDNNLFVTLYGSSGIGKTSLLRAGVIPILRRKDYYPLYVRLSQEPSEISYAEAIIQKMINSGLVIEKSANVNHLDSSNRLFLWEYFATTRFLNDGREVYPVIILDQFEEVFREGNKSKAELLLKQIYLLLNDEMELPDEAGWSSDTNYRFVASIREDFLFVLEDSIDENSLDLYKNNRYRLRPMKPQQARQVVLMPGKDCIEETEKDVVTERIISLSKRQQGNDIDTLMLSLVCAGTYEKKSGEKITLSDLVIWKNNPMEVYYKDAVKGLTANQIRYIQQHFIRDDGSRRRVEADEVITVLGEATYLQLTKGKNRLFAIGDKEQIELLHDQLGMAVYEERRAFEEHERKKKQRRRLLTIIGLSLLSAILGLGVGGNSLRQKKLTEMALSAEETARQMAEKATKENENTIKKLEKAKKEKENTIKELEEKNIVLAQLIAQLEYEKENVRLEQKRVALANIEANRNKVRLQIEWAKKCLEDGDSYTARILALNALINNDNLYIPEAEAALRKASVENGAVLHAYFSTPIESKFTANGNFIISSGEDLKVWDANNGALIKTIPNMYYNPISIRKQEVLVAADSTIFKFDKDWNLIPVHKYNRKISLFPENSNNYVSLEGFKITFVDGYKRWSRNDSIAVVIESQSGDSLMALVHNKRINSVNYSHDGNLIVTASEDNSVKLWDAKTGVLYKTLLGHLPTPPPYTSSIYSADNGVMYALFNSNDSLVFSCSRDKTIRLWSVASGECVDTIFFKSPIYSFALNRDDSYIWAACGDGNIYGYNILTQEMGRILKGHSSDVINICYSPNYRRLVSTGNDGAIRIWSGQYRDLYTKLQGHTDFGCTVSYSPKGDMIVSTSRDSTIGLWSNYGYLRKRLVGHTGDVFTANFSRDGKSIVSASSDSTIRIWDVQKRKEVKKLTGHHDWVTSAAFSTNGDYVISSSQDSTIRVWCVSTGECIDSIRDKEYLGYSEKNIMFSADGHYFYVNNKKIYKYDISTKQIIDSIGVDGILCYNFNPDSTLIAYAVLDTISIWSIEQKKVILKWKTKENGGIAHVGFSQDGRYCLSVGLWSPLKIWDVKTGTLIKEYNDNWNSCSASFSPSDDYIVTTGGEPLGERRSNSTELWKFPKLELLIKQTQDRFGNRKLTHEERRKYYLE